MLTSGNSVIKNIIHLFYSTAFASLINAIALIVLAQYLGSYHYGIFSVILAFAMVMSFFTDAGLSQIVIREGSKKENNLSSVITSFIKMRICLLTFTLIVGFLVIHSLYGGQRDIIESSYFLIIPMVLGVGMQSIGTTFFQLKEQMQVNALIKILCSSFLIIFSCVGMFLSVDPKTVCFLYGLSYLLAGLVSILIVSKQIKMNFKGEFHRGLFNQLGLFSVAGLLFVIGPQMGPVIIEKTLSLMEVGLFAVAYRIPQALQQIPFIIAGAFYPVLFRYYNSNQKKKQLDLTILQVKLMAVIGMSMMIPFYYFSPLIIELIFGELWMAAAETLKILSVILLLQAVNVALADGLTTRGLQSKRALIQAISIGTGCILYFILSRSYGIVGAAFTGVIIEAVALLGYWIFIPDRRKIGLRSLVPYLLLLLLSIGAVDFALSNLPWLAATVQYAVLLILLLTDKDILDKLYMIKNWQLRKSKGAENGL